jgi:hypothetical protein
MRRGSCGGWRRLAIGVIAAIVSIGWSVASRAEGVSPPPEAPVVSPGGEVPSPPPPPPPAALPQAVDVASPAAETRRVESDFDVEQRHWALGYAGVSIVPTGAGSITVPAVGLRYWVSPSTGIDVALGISWTGGSTDSAGMSTDKNAVFGLLFQGGVPFVLATHRHVNFEAIPYLTVGYGRTSTGMNYGYMTETDFNGLRLDVGARAGFEVFFGFIGIPELALSATVGVQFEYLRTGQSMAGVDASDTTLSISTTVQNNPWDIFAGNISARYYF